MDWIHHIPVYILNILMFSTLSGPVFQLHAIILTGVPGGIEYFLLTLEGEGWLSRARVKALQSGINATIRLPLGFIGGYACLLGLYNTWAALAYWPRFVFFFMGIHACWNATFFGTMAIQAEVVDTCKRVLDAEGIDHSTEGRFIVCIPLHPPNPPPLVYCISFVS